MCYVLCVSRTITNLFYRLESKFGYMILTKPEPPSLLRQLAYQENSELLGPEADPVGWKTLASVPVRINGLVFNQRDVDATCKVPEFSFRGINVSHPLVLMLVAIVSRTCKPPSSIDHSFRTDIFDLAQLYQRKCHSLRVGDRKQGYSSPRLTLHTHSYKNPSNALCQVPRNGWSNRRRAEMERRH